MHSEEKRLVVKHASRKQARGHGEGIVDTPPSSLSSLRQTPKTFSFLKRLSVTPQVSDLSVLLNYSILFVFSFLLDKAFSRFLGFSAYM